MSNADKSGIADSVKQRLLNVARERHEHPNIIFARYALERFLYRLSCSSHRSEFILKGAMLFEVWQAKPHRATRDMDFLAKGEVNPQTIEAKIRAVCGIDFASDAVRFNLDGLSIKEIREDNRYGGFRAKFIAEIGAMKIPVQLDFGIGDAVTPGPVETNYPTLLDMPQPHVLAYPRETVIAEKLQAIVELEIDNSRMKDFFDLWFILTMYDDSPATIAKAIKNTFANRGLPIPQEVPVGLSDEFAEHPKKREQWQAFVAKSVGDAPGLDEIVHVIRKTAMKVFDLASK